MRHNATQTNGPAQPGAGAATAADISVLFPDVPDATVDELKKGIAYETPIEKLAPWDSGPGLVVLDPVTDPGLSSMRDVGRGAAAWLDFVVAGQPRFGQSPAFSNIDRARQELHLPDTALPLEQAQDLARRLGATHIAVGSLTGTPGHCVLTYRLYDGASGTAVGTPFAASGSVQQVAVALPGLAQKLGKALGGDASRIPASTGLSPSDMALIGRARWLDEDKLSPGDRAAMEALGMKSPIAAFLRLTRSKVDSVTLQDRLVQTMLSQPGGEPIALADLAITDFEIGKLATRIDRAFQTSPHNALYARTATYLHRADGQAALERKAAEAVLRSAPNSPDSWLTLALTITNEADSVRHARTNAMMTDAEHAFIDELYPQALRCASNAAALDADFGKGWLRVAKAASFDGDEATAQAAFDKAIALNPNHAEVYHWGLQIYQPKWYRDDVKLGQVADLAVADSYPDYDAMESVARDMADAGLGDKMKSLVRKYAETMQRNITQGRDVAKSHWALGSCRQFQGDNRQALAEYRLAIAADPGNPKYHSDTGDVLDELGDIPGAMKEYRQAIALDPHRAVDHYNLGFDLFKQKATAQAATELAASIALDPLRGDAYYTLGDLEENRHNLKNAAQNYGLAAVRLNHNQAADDAWIRLLDNTHQYNKALKVGKLTLMLNPEDDNAAANLSDVYLNLHQGGNAVRMAQYCLGLKPNDPVGHENLAEGYKLLGQMDRAKAEWRIVAGLGDPGMAKLAQGFLSQYGG